MHTNVQYLGCDKVETWGYFQLLDMRYSDWNMEFLVALVDGSKPQTNNTTITFILDIAIILERSVWNNY